MFNLFFKFYPKQSIPAINPALQRFKILQFNISNSY